MKGEEGLDELANRPASLGEAIQCLFDFIENDVELSKNQLNTMDGL